MGNSNVSKIVDQNGKTWVVQERHDGCIKGIRTTEGGDIEQRTFDLDNLTAKEYGRLANRVIHWEHVPDRVLEKDKEWKEPSPEDPEWRNEFMDKWSSALEDQSFIGAGWHELGIDPRKDCTKVFVSIMDYIEEVEKKYNRLVELLVVFRNQIDEKVDELD